MRHDRIIDLFGGNEPLARLIDRHHSAVSRWRTKGIPPLHWPEVARLAQRLSLPITWEDLAAGQPRASRNRLRSSAARSVA